MIQMSMYGALVSLASDRGMCQVQHDGNEPEGFRVPDFPEGQMLRAARDYNPILADWIEMLDGSLRQYGLKASPTELLQHLRLHALTEASEPTLTLSAVPVTMQGHDGRLTQVQRGTVISYGIDLGDAQSIRETDHVAVAEEA